MSSVRDAIAPPADQRRPDLDPRDDLLDADPYIVILYNDDYHTVDEVVHQLIKATGYDVDRCVQIMLEAHTLGRAIAYSGSAEQCEHAARVLRQIRLQVETDRR